MTVILIFFIAWIFLLVPCFFFRIKGLGEFFAQFLYGPVDAHPFKKLFSQKINPGAA